MFHVSETTMRKPLNRAALVLLALLLAVVAMAAQDDLLKAPLLDRAAVLKSAAQITRDKYPNADDVLVDDMIRVRYEADGTSIETDETYMKVLTEKGKRENRSLSRHFTASYGDANFDILEIIKPDGTVIPIDVKKNSKLMINPSGMGSNIYNPNSKVIRVNIAGFEVGDTLHYVTRRWTFLGIPMPKWLAPDINI